MRKTKLGILCAALAMSFISQGNAAVPDTLADPEQTQESVPADNASSALPAIKTLGPILVTTHKAIRAKYLGHEDLLLKFRLSQNLPEITNEALLGGPANANTGKVGTMPRLTVLPCDVGCTGNSDYEKAVKSFLKSYNQPIHDGAYAFQGAMTVKVRWFKQRNYFEKKMLPLPGRMDTFAISFPLEGKLVTISMRDGSERAQMDELTTRASGWLSLQMIMNVGIGVKPKPLQVLLPSAELNWLNKFDNSTVPQTMALLVMLGGDDYRSRIEPMAEADKVLLPAIDGIEPNEVDPLNETVFLNFM